MPRDVDLSEKSKLVEMLLFDMGGTMPIRQDVWRLVQLDARTL